MSVQKSDTSSHPAHNDQPEQHEHHHPSFQNGDLNKLSLDTDPYAAPNVYYGASHSSRRVAKSRTYSAVSTAPARDGIRVAGLR